MRERVNDRGRLEHMLAEHADTPWEQIEKMRHVLVHGYYQILPEVLWLTIKDDLPALKANIRNYLSSFEELTDSNQTH